MTPSLSSSNQIPPFKPSPDYDANLDAFDGIGELLPKKKTRLPRSLDCRVGIRSSFQLHFSIAGDGRVGLDELHDLFNLIAEKEEILVVPAFRQDVEGLP